MSSGFPGGDPVFLAEPPENKTTVDVLALEMMGCNRSAGPDLCAGRLGILGEAELQFVGIVIGLENQ